MKKLLWPLCIIAVLLSAAGLGFVLGYMAEELPYDQISGTDMNPPAHPVSTISILHEGDYPGMSDTPVTAEQAMPGRSVLNALQDQKYNRLFPFCKPRKNGIAIQEISGCSPFYIAYWDGKRLWLPGEKEGQWLGYTPSSPNSLAEKLTSINNTN